MLSQSVMSDSLWPHGLLPARLLCPWNLSGKNIGAGWHFLLQMIFLTQDWNLSLLSLLALAGRSAVLGKPPLHLILLLNHVLLFHPMDCSPPGSSVHGDSPGKNTGAGCHALLQGIEPNLGIEPRSPTLQVDSLLSEPAGKPKNTQVGSLSILQGNFLTQELNRVSCITGRFFTSWATREALLFC